MARGRGDSPCGHRPDHLHRRKNAEPDDTPDETPKECWSLAGINYNPNDPAMFVPNRFAYGYTLNFANPWARAFLVVMVGGVAGLTGFLIWALR